MKTAVIDVGGGLRGVYATGVFDRCLDEGVSFDVCIGISAGSANLSSFLAGQRGRNLTFYTVYDVRKEAMSAGNFLRDRSYINLDYIYETLSVTGGENPLDYKAIMENPSEFYIVAANAVTGETRYFTKEDMAQDNYDIMKASCAIPFVCRPYVIDGVPYYDGALGDTIPIRKAFELGCDKVVLILTKPRDAVRTAGKDKLFARGIEKKYPRAAERLRGRAERYNRGVTIAKGYEAQGKALIVAPDDTCGMDTLTKDKEAMMRFYEKGYEDGKAIEAFLRN